MLKYKSKQLTSGLLTIAMILGLFPTQTFANDNIPKKLISKFDELDENIRIQNYNVGDNVEVIFPQELSIQITGSNIIEIEEECSHEHIHDEECGYSVNQEGVEETPCTFVCEENHLIEKEEVYVTKDNVPITWVLEGDNEFSIESPNTFYYQAKLIDDTNYVIANDIELPKITVNILENLKVTPEKVEDEIIEEEVDEKVEQETDTSKVEEKIEDIISKLENYLNEVRPLHENNSTTLKLDISEEDSLTVTEESGPIDIKYFNFYCAQEPSTDFNITESFINSGKINDNAPQVLYANMEGDEELYKHTYVAAYVDNTAITHVGALIVDGVEYIYYVVDYKDTNSVVYSILKEGEKIDLEYSHKFSLEVNYKFQNNNTITELGPAGTSIDEVFGEDRSRFLEKNGILSIEVEVPRGYTATLIASYGEDEIYKANIGEMPTYRLDGHEIVLEDDSVEILELNHSYSIPNITKDITLTLTYEEIDEYIFDMSMWPKTMYAKNRIQYYSPSGVQENFTNSNSIFTLPFTEDNSLGFVSTNTQGHSWEMNQMEINGEKIKVPHINMESNPELYSTEYKWETTVLRSGTIIKLGVKSINITNPAFDTGWQRQYKFEVENCYENLIVTQGNMYALSHREIILDTSEGIDDTEAFVGYDETKFKPVSPRDWIEVSDEVLLNRRLYSHYSDPIRFKRDFGYQTVDHVILQTKDGILLQENGTIAKGSEPFIEYLVLKDNVQFNDEGNPMPLGEGQVSQNGNDTGMIDVSIYDEQTFEVVTFDEWKASTDGYWYLRATEALDNIQREESDYGDNIKEKGSLLLNIEAPLIKGALDYQSGANMTNDEGEKIAPDSEDIINMPTYQNGGENGYNIIDNKEVLISNKTPFDSTGEFIFKEWVLLATTTDEENPFGKLTNSNYNEDGKEFRYKSSESLNIIDDFLSGSIGNALYYKKDESRSTATLRAVWEKSTVELPIAYTSNFYIEHPNEEGILEDKLIESRTHLVNLGATIISDLYSTIGGKKSISQNLKNIINGANKYNTAYPGKWIVDEERSTMKIDSVAPGNNTINIYLINNETTITASKKWLNIDTPPSSINIQLQRQNEGSWENVGEPIALNNENSWTTSFLVELYKTDGSKITGNEHIYRVVELDENNNIIEAEDYVSYNGYTFEANYENIDNHWNINNTMLERSITFDTLGGIPTPDVQIIPYGHKGIKPTIEPIKTGYTFSGWYTSKDNGETLDDSEYNFDTAVTENITLYAKWTPIKYEVAFDGNGATSGEMSNQIFEYNIAEQLEKSVFERDGYTFLGWTANPKSKIVGYEDTQEVVNLFKEDGSMVTLYAVWSMIPPTYYNIEIEIEGEGTITPNGGANSVEEVKEGDSKLFTINPAEGWYLEDVLIDGISIGKLTEYEFENIQKNHTIKVIFKQEEELPTGPTEPPTGPTEPPTGPTEPTEPPTNPETSIPQTGDSSNTMQYLIISLISAFSIIIARNKKVKV